MMPAESVLFLVTHPADSEYRRNGASCFIINLAGGELSNRLCPVLLQRLQVHMDREDWIARRSGEM